MKRTAFAALLVASTIMVSGCSTLRGAAIGGGLGAGAAAVTGGNVEQGAAVGGVAGGVIGTVAD